MQDEATKGVKCPFCGAPYKKLIPSEVLQLKCPYCGATFQIPSRIGHNIPACENHPERYASGTCNDCRGRFCTECLNRYDMSARSERATLFLCARCLKDRELRKTWGATTLGAMLIAMGTFVTLLTGFIIWPFGVFIVLIGSALAAHGFLSRYRIIGEFEAARVTPRQEASEEAELRPETKEIEGIDAEKIYFDLLAEYTDHWGAQTGEELLDNEIKAYTWRGESFAEGIRKVRERHLQETRNKKRKP